MKHYILSDRSRGRHITIDRRRQRCLRENTNLSSHGKISGGLACQSERLAGNIGISERSGGDCGLFSPELPIQVKSDFSFEPSFEPPLTALCNVKPTPLPLLLPLTALCQDTQDGSVLHPEGLSFPVHDGEKEGGILKMERALL